MSVIIFEILCYILIFNTKFQFQWIKEIKEFCQKTEKVPILIAGLQKNKDSSDTKQRGEQLARRIDEVAEYVECTDDKVNRFNLILYEVLSFIKLKCKVSFD